VEIPSSFMRAKWFFIKTNFLNQIKLVTDKMPPPQKNKGTRGGRKEVSVSSKNTKFMQNLMDDIRSEGGVEDVFIGRVTKKMGNARMEVLFSEGGTIRTISALIRGTFRGRRKRHAFIDIGSFVAIGKTGMDGSLEFEIIAVLTRRQVHDISDEMPIDPRVITDTGVVDSENVGFEFDTSANPLKEEDEEESINIDEI